MIRCSLLPAVMFTFFRHSTDPSFHSFLTFPCRLSSGCFRLSCNRCTLPTESFPPCHAWQHVLYEHAHGTTCTMLLSSLQNTAIISDSRCIRTMPTMPDNNEHTTYRASAHYTFISSSACCFVPAASAAHPTRLPQLPLPHLPSVLKLSLSSAHAACASPTCRTRLSSSPPPHSSRNNRSKSVATRAPACHRTPQLGTRTEAAIIQSGCTKKA